MKYYVIAAALALVPGMLLGALFVAPVAEGFVPANDGHVAWTLSRAAGLVAFALIAASLAGGALMSSAFLDGYIHRGRLLALHQSLSLAGLTLSAVHIIALLFDDYAEFSVVDLFVPFAAEDNTVLIGIGVTSFYLLILASATFWVRRLIGMRTWRYVHLSSIVAFVGAGWHGFALGSDSGITWVQAVYLAGVFAVVAALVVRLAYRRPKPVRKALPA